jgi:hypothetical protein
MLLEDYLLVDGGFSSYAPRRLSPGGWGKHNGHCFVRLSVKQFVSLLFPMKFNLTKVRSNKLLDLMTARRHRIYALAIFPDYYF